MSKARQFGKLVLSVESVQLRIIFFATSEMTKEAAWLGAAAKINKVEILGVGWWAAASATKAGLPARTKDIRSEGFANGIKYNDYGKNPGRDVDESIYTLLGISPVSKRSPEQIWALCITDA